SPAPQPAPAPHPVPEQGDSYLRLTETAPQESVTKAVLLDAIRKANQRLNIAMYLFAEPELLEAVCAARKRGVQVRAIFDPRLTSTTKFGSIGRFIPDGMPNLAAARDLLQAGAQVHWFTPTEPEQEAHMKVLMVDGRTVIAGSTNWTRNSFVRW